MRKDGGLSRLQAIETSMELGWLETNLNLQGDIGSLLEAPLRQTSSR